MYFILLVFLGTYYCEMVVHIHKVCSEMFTAVVFVICKTTETTENVHQHKNG